MMRQTLRLLTVTASILAMTATATLAHHRPGHQGGPPGHAGGSPPGHGGSSGLDAGDLVASGLTYAAILRLLDGDRAPLHVGAQSLPPGIAMNLARGKPLPPGIARRTVPGGLYGRLPRYDGYDWVRIGPELVLIEVATGVVAEVIYDIFN